MKAYQEEYLELLRLVSTDTRDSGAGEREFMESTIAAAIKRAEAVNRGTALLRQELFPVLDDILSTSDEEISQLYDFASLLMRGVEQMDVGLHYRIHLALMDYARHKGLRDMLIRELYHVGMSLFNFETMLTPNNIRLYRTRMRVCFAEAASYYDTQYDEITDPETRGYIHRAMGNIALSYDEHSTESAVKKLEAVSRSIDILSDPDVRAKTPSLPWDLYLYKSHQERTSLLAFLRKGTAGPDAFAKVMDSAQTVQERQLQAARERGEPLQPRWQYAYMAARYHCGAMLLPELLDGLYALSYSRPEDDFSAPGMFSHVSAPALFMEYAKQLKGAGTAELSVRIKRMTDRMLHWLSRAPYSSGDEQLMFYLRQFLYTYMELDGCMPFYELLQDVFAMRYERGFIRMFIAGRIAGILTGWAEEDCPEVLIGLLGTKDVGEVIWRRRELLDFATRAGRLSDAGMVHFFRFVSAAPRGLFEEEEAILRLHAHCGAELLRQRPSTAPFADIARGHHVSFDEKSGFPVDFSPKESGVRPLLYIVAAADVLAASFEEISSRYRPAVSFDKALEDIEAGSGTKYAPFIAKLLKPAHRRESLREELGKIRAEGYSEMYRRRKGGDVS